MSTTTDSNDLPPPPPPVTTKPRLNPLDFRNTDLVSRLLAATPPYLYNMPMVPNSYFFSEMLRSFVQAKTEASSSTNTSPAAIRHNANSLGYQRRARKRPWTHQSQYFDTPKPTTWKRPADVPLELTAGKIGESSSLKALCGSTDTLTDQEKVQSIDQQQAAIVNNYHNVSQALSTQDTSSNLLLPPAPPLWYPSMYPPPYGIDPLHFFIDLRVSGHIYDRKNGKEAVNTADSTQNSTQPGVITNNQAEQNKDVFRQSRHASAFSVPVSTGGGKSNIPMNLSNVKNESDKKLKFDVKSMVYNKTGTSYVMRNINSIYKEMSSQQQQHQQQQQQQQRTGEENGTTNNDINVDDDASDENDIKQAKHFKAIFGLELMVDYMKKKPRSTVINVNSDSSGSTSENESVGSPALDVVDVNEDSSNL